MQDKSEESNLQLCEKHLEAGRRLMAARAVESAAQQFRTALSHNPDHANGHALLAWALSHCNQLQEAQHEVNIALSLDAQDAYPMYMKGCIYKRQHLDQEAESWLRRAVAAEPTWGAPYESLASALQNQKRHAEATSVAREAIALRPDSAEAYMILGHSLVELRQGEEAEEVAQTALRLAPEHAQVYSLLAHCYMSTNQPHKAEEALRSTLAIAPHDFTAHYQLAQILSQRERYEEALDEINAALQSHSQDASALYLKGCCLVRLSRWESARDVLQQALTRGNTVQCYIVLISVYAQLQDDAQMEVAIQRAMELAGKRPHIWSHLGRMLKSHGKEEEAKLALDTAVKLQSHKREGCASGS